VLWMGFLKHYILCFMSLSNEVRVLAFVLEMSRKSLKSNKSATASSKSSFGEPTVHLNVDHKETSTNLGLSNTGRRARISSSRYDCSGKIIAE